MPDVAARTVLGARLKVSGSATVWAGLSGIGDMAGGSASCPPMTRCMDRRCVAREIGEQK